MTTYVMFRAVRSVQRNTAPFVDSNKAPHEATNSRPALSSRMSRTVIVMTPITWAISPTSSPKSPPAAPYPRIAMKVTVSPKFADIKAIALDVDGVLTDGRFWWNAAGDEWKCFSFADVMGLSRAKRAGIIVTLISGENSPLVDRFAVKLEISDYTKGCKDKAEALRGFVARHDLALSNVCFMGDDVNDLEAMGLAGCSAAPADARPAVLAIAQVVSRFGGGNGAVREIVDLIISSKESTKRNG